MRLHEVLESGRKFRRKGRGLVYNVTRPDTVSFIPSDIIADDWEIVEEKIELTESQIRKVLNDFKYAGRIQNIDAVNDIVFELLGARND
jgi:hypothetical protein